MKKSQYESLKKAVENQHGESNPDFAHCQIALAARLAYTLNKEGLASNIGSHFFMMMFHIWQDGLETRHC